MRKSAYLPGIRQQLSNGGNDFKSREHHVKHSWTVTWCYSNRRGSKVCKNTWYRFLITCWYWCIYDCNNHIHYLNVYGDYSVYSTALSIRVYNWICIYTGSLHDVYPSGIITLSKNRKSIFPSFAKKCLGLALDTTEFSWPKHGLKIYRPPQSPCRRPILHSC